MINRTVRALLRRGGLVRSETGATAVEFALVLPVLILLVGGIFEGGLVLHTWGQMEHIGRQAARAVAVGAATEDQAESFIASKMQQSVGSLVVVASVTTSAGATAFENAVVARVTVPGSELVKILPFGLFRPTSLESVVSLRLET